MARRPSSLFGPRDLGERVECLGQRGVERHGTPFGAQGGVPVRLEFPREPLLEHALTLEVTWGADDAPLLAQTLVHGENLRGELDAAVPAEQDRRPGKRHCLVVLLADLLEQWKRCEQFGRRT